MERPRTGPMLFRVAVTPLLLSSSVVAQAAASPLGAARSDVTPEGPIRLSGYGARRSESEGVTLRLYARALAIGADADAPVVLVAIETCVLDFALTDALAQRLQARAKIDRAHLVVAATHSHTAPMLAGTLPNLFAADIPDEQQRHIRDYTAFVLDRLEAAVLGAWAARSPGR